jgi:hypothetical protein
MNTVLDLSRKLNHLEQRAAAEQADERRFFSRAFGKARSDGLYAVRADLGHLIFLPM